jgi:mRNA interferase MazF
MAIKKSFDSGNIVLVPFPFSDLSKNKVRPAIVLACDKEDYTLVFVTTIVPKGSLVVEIVPSKGNNLKMQSYIRYTKFASLDRSIILGKIGELSPHDFEIVKKNIKNYLSL